MQDVCFTGFGILFHVKKQERGRRWQNQHFWLGQKTQLLREERTEERFGRWHWVQFGAYWVPCEWELSKKTHSYRGWLLYVSGAQIIGVLWRENRGIRGDEIIKATFQENFPDLNDESLQTKRDNQVPGIINKEDPHQPYPRGTSQQWGEEGVPRASQERKHHIQNAEI